MKSVRVMEKLPSGSSGKLESSRGRALAAGDDWADVKRFPGTMKSSV